MYSIPLHNHKEYYSVRAKIYIFTKYMLQNKLSFPPSLILVHIYEVSFKVKDTFEKFDKTHTTYLTLTFFVIHRTIRYLK